MRLAQNVQPAIDRAKEGPSVDGLFQALMLLFEKAINPSACATIGEAIVFADIGGLETLTEQVRRKKSFLAPYAR